MLSPDLLLVDINGLGYAAMYQPNLARLSHKGMPTAALHGALVSLFSRMAEYPQAVPVVVWDGHARWRKEFYPEYKSNRSDTPEKLEIRANYAKQVPYLQLMLMQLGIPQIRAPYAEADDIAGVICRNMAPCRQIQQVTRDTDWWQGLASNITWYSPLSKREITLEELANPENGLSDGYFLSPEEYIHCKALAGDSSDCIAGVEKVGLKTAAKHLRQFGSMQALWERYDAGERFKGATLEKLVSPETRELYARNLRLMDWRLAPELDTSELAAFFLEPDFADFSATAEDFGLTRMAMQAQKHLPYREDWAPVWKEVLKTLGQ